MLADPPNPLVFTVFSIITMGTRGFGMESDAESRRAETGRDRQVVPGPLINLAAAAGSGSRVWAPASAAHIQVITRDRRIGLGTAR